jgi:hypothetical protein
VTYPTYPKRAEDVTADSLIRALVDTAQQATHRRQHYVNRRDVEGRALYLFALEQSVADFGVAFLLRGLALHNVTRADEAARQLWQHWEDADTPLELLWEWCQQYGIPTEPDPARQPDDG